MECPGGYIKMHPPGYFIIHVMGYVRRTHMNREIRTDLAIELRENVATFILLYSKCLSCVLAVGYIFDIAVLKRLR